MESTDSPARPIGYRGCIPMLKKASAPCLHAESDASHVSVAKPKIFVLALRMRQSRSMIEGCSCFEALIVCIEISELRESKLGSFFGVAGPTKARPAPSSTACRAAPDASGPRALPPP